MASAVVMLVDYSVEVDVLSKVLREEEKREEKAFDFKKKIEPNLLTQFFFLHV